MKLILTIQGLDRLDNGLPARLDLAERGAIIGRSPTVSWCLPDPSNHISSRHAEVGFRDGVYTLTDTSTNGTFVNGRQLTSPHPLNTGDMIDIGQYRIRAEVEGQAAPAGGPAAPPPQSQPSSAWAAWDSPAPAAAAPPPPVQPRSDGWGPPPGPAPVAPPASASGWEPAPAAPSPPPPSEWGPSPQSSGASPWDVGAAPPPPAPASQWSSAIPEVAPAPSADDVWGRFAENHVVDWARGGFGQPAPELKPASAPLGLDTTNNFVQSLPPVEQKWAGHAPAEAPPAPVVPVVPAPQPVQPAPLALDGFTQQLGLSPADLKGSPEETLATSAVLLRRLIAGMVVMLEARARAKSQMGAQGTALSFDGNNPLKFARTPEQALAQLLNAPERGFMPAERAVEDAFLDLQSHQMATLKAMQGALKATLDRFSPAAIRERAEKKGIMAKIFPDARDAALWKAYEKEFSGVVHGSDEAFMDVFAKEFRKAYEALTMKKGF